MARTADAEAQVRNYTVTFNNHFLDACIEKTLREYERPLSWQIRRLLYEWLRAGSPMWLGDPAAGALTPPAYRTREAEARQD